MSHWHTLPLHVADYQTDRAVRMMSLAQRGLFDALLMCQWIDGPFGGGPDEIGEIARMVGYDRRVIAHHWPGLVEGLFPPGPDGMRANPKLEAVRVRALMRGTKQARRAAANAITKGSQRDRNAITKGSQRDPFLGPGSGDSAGFGAKNAPGNTPINYEHMNYPPTPQTSGGEDGAHPETRAPRIRLVPPDSQGGRGVVLGEIADAVAAAQRAAEEAKRERGKS